VARKEMWVHGHSATIEVHRVGRGEAEDVNGVPWTSVIGMRLGWGVVYRGVNNHYCFHLPIPTLAIDDGVRARLRRAMVLFTADEGVTLERIDVWDGPDAAFTLEGLAVGGKNVTLVDGRNSFETPDHGVRWGLGLCATFRFAGACNVTLHSAGVEFEA
jgi:hypothetical protein